MNKVIISREAAEKRQEKRGARGKGGKGVRAEWHLVKGI